MIKVLHYCYPIFFIASLLLVILPFGSSDLINDTCKRTPNYQLCSSILRADPKSSGADVTGLALIVVNSLKSKSISALLTINQLLRTLPMLRAPLSECSRQYNFIVRYDITAAVEALTKGNPKFAEEGTNDAVNVVQECRNGFKLSPSPPPLTKLNALAHDTAAVALAIVRLLL